MVYYAIHGAIDVAIDSNVDRSVISAIDFQLNYFRKKSVPKALAPYQIIIKPYGDFTPDSQQPFSKFHLSRGLQGSCFHDPAIRFAIEKSYNYLKIYCEAPNFLINLYIQFFLTEIGYTMVHAAAVDKDGDVVLFPAAGGVGKTALLGQLVTRNGFRPMGDDIVILSKQGKCLSFPRSFVLKECHRSVYPKLFRRLNIRKTTNYKLKRFIVENAPFVGIAKNILRRQNLYHKAVDSINLTPNLAAVPVEEIFGHGIVSDSGDIKRIVFLERYEGTKFKLLPISEDALCRRMFAIIHHEWVDSMRQCFSVTAMELVDLPVYFNRTSEIIRAGISGKNSQIFYIPTNATFTELIAAFYKLSQEL